MSNVWIPFKKIMKRNIHIAFIFVLGTLCLSDITVKGQDAPRSRIPVSLAINYQKIDGVKSIVVRVSSKEDGNDIPVSGPITNLYLNEVKKHDHPTGTGWIGNYGLNRNGEALFTLVDGLKSITQGMRVFTFIAKMVADPYYEDIQKEIEIKDAKILITFSKENSVTAKLVQWKDSLTEIPAENVRLRLFIKDTSSFLPLGNQEALTNMNGEVSAQIPRELIGGEMDKEMTIVAKIENHENFGTVLYSKTVSLNAKNSGGNVPYFLIMAAIVIALWAMFKMKNTNKKSSPDVMK